MQTKSIGVTEKRNSPKPGLNASWIILWKPGSKLGPCWNCTHFRCNHMRQLARRTCPICKKALGYQARLIEFSSQAENTPDDSRRFCHYDCVEELRWIKK
jgi:hypothetical protein